MDFGRSLPSGPVVEHGTSRLGRWLRARRLRIAVWIALIEGLLIIVHAVPRLTALIVAGSIVAIYLWAGRRIDWDAGRQLGWIIATSQALVLLVPVFLIFVWTLAVVVVAILGVIALVALFSERA
ncbi:MAG: hypothetical protein M3R70_01900 [Actinomycetota bacterium]|nr:hypothetical protein [Actinomycetota bacterium]